jgi:pimeloyl-ACP methyl ester carboxylesterase
MIANSRASRLGSSALRIGCMIRAETQYSVEGAAEGRRRAQPSEETHYRILEQHIFTPERQKAMPQTTFIPLGSLGGRNQIDRLRPRAAPRALAVLYRPDDLQQSRSRVGVIVMHATASFLAHPSCGQLADRGYTVLAVDPPLANRNMWEDLPEYMAMGVRYLRDSGLVDSVVLLGHSGGGPLALFYQSVAENGPGRGQDSNKIVPLPDSLAGLPAADGVVLLDSHMSPSFMTLTYLDPSVKDGNLEQRDASLDMYAESNGYRASGATYSPAFRRAFFAAQAERHMGLVRQALERAAVISRGDGMYLDDEPLVIHGLTPRIWFADRSLLSHTRAAHTILHGDGSRSHEQARSVRPIFGSEAGRRTYSSACLQLSVNEFLSWHAVRADSDYAITEDCVEGIDWSSSNTSAPWNAEGVTVPLLIASMTGHYFLAPDELIYEHALSSDKELVFVEGAEHDFKPCKASEPSPGCFGDTMKTTFDYVDGWLAQRFA